VFSSTINLCIISLMISNSESPRIPPPSVQWLLVSDRHCGNGKQATLPSASSFNSGFAVDEDMAVKTKRIDQESMAWGPLPEVISHATLLISQPSTTLVPSISLLVDGDKKKPGTAKVKSQAPWGLETSPHSLKEEDLTDFTSSPLGGSVYSVCSNHFMDNLINSYMWMSTQASDLTPSRHSDARHRASIATFPVSSFCDYFKSKIQLPMPLDTFEPGSLSK